MKTPMDTRSLTEGAMLAAITVVLALLGVYFFSYLLFIVPVPIAILVYRHGLRAGILVSVTAAMISGFFGTMVTTFIFLLVIGLVGIAIGGALRENQSAPMVMVIGSGVAVIALVLLTGVAMLFFGADLVERTFEMMEESFEYAYSLYESMGVDTSQILGGVSVAELIAMMKTILPSAVVLTGIGITFVNYWLTRTLLRRFTSKEVPWFQPFGNWKFASYLVWGFILAKALLLILQTQNNPLLLQVAMNLEIIFNYVYLLQGMAIAWWFLNNWQVATFIRVLLLFLAITSPVATMLIFLGVLDTWFDWRKLERQDNQ